MGHVEVGITTNVPLSIAQYYIHLPQVRVIAARQVINRVAEVNIVIVEPIHEIPDIEFGAHTEQVTDHIGVAEGKISRVIAPKTGPGYRHLGYVIGASNGIDHLVFDKVDVVFVIS